MLCKKVGYILYLHFTNFKISDKKFNIIIFFTTEYHIVSLAENSRNQLWDVLYVVQSGMARFSWASDLRHID